MTQRILAFSGNKQSGKNTAANFVAAEELQSLGVLQKYFINENGHIVTFTTEGEAGILDLTSKNAQWQIFLIKEVWPFVKIYSFADSLKNICINLFGLTDEQCYGTDKQKNSFTKYYWKDMFQEVRKSFGFKNLKDCGNKKITARQMLQLVGTDIFRKINDTCWVDSLINQIQEEKSPLAIISDCRFLNEIKGVHKVGGKVIHLTRNIEQDLHSSENELKNCKDFDMVIDNQNMSIEEQNQAVKLTLKEWGWWND